jgi:photosystem II stability/assembly factor-like uncharacterized protein
MAKKKSQTKHPEPTAMPQQDSNETSTSAPLAHIERGPRKTRATGTPTPRLVTHKLRSQWFRARTAWPMREAPTHTMVRARGQADRGLAPAPGNAQWELVGPTNIGGRMTCAVTHPDHPERIWAGAAGGGVWFSPDSGQSWQVLWHSEDVLNIGALALDPGNPQLLYAGTGEANLSADSYAGVGLYRTLDSGQTWHLLASSEQTGIPTRIGVIAIDPFNAKHLRLGGVGFAELSSFQNDVGGMYTSTDGGVTWTRETFLTSKNYWCHSIVFDPKTPGLLYATFTAQGARSGIYRSDDGGQTWRQLTNGLPVPERFHRTTLALSLSNPKVLYAIAADAGSEFADRLLGVFRTANRGNKWTEVTGGALPDEGQMSYGNTIVVHPRKPNHVLCGGVDLHLTTNGGKTWQKVTRWNAARGDSDYAHADHHCLLMPQARPGRVYDLNDGGLDLSEDGGQTWANRSNGLAVTMYYDLDVAQSDERMFGGGAQDNGTLITVTGSRDDHFEILGGDGGWMVIDPNNKNHLFASYQGFHILRYKNGWKEVFPPGDQGSVWMCYITMDPNDSRTIFTGSKRVWRSRNDADTWKPVSSELDGSPITAIEIAPADSQRIYVGTENGGFFRSLDRGETWSANLASTDLPGHSITRLETKPDDAEVLYATVANRGHSHVFRSNDGGFHWEDVDKGQLPNVAHHSIVIPPDAPDTVYVCSDVGVFVTFDAAQTWMSLTRNLPNVMVVDLVYHRNARTLSAATYGRSGDWTCEERTYLTLSQSVSETIPDGGANCLCLHQFFVWRA